MTATTDAPGMLPTPAHEARLWALIESAWAELGAEPAALRQALVERDPAGDDSDDDGPSYAIDDWLDRFLDRLRHLCAELTGPELTDLDRVVERKLYDIDREDIHEVTDGSDDGFLYCRGFIVALGQAYYEAVRANPAMALLDADCESMCYFFAHLHNDRFGSWPETGSGISRESFGNRAGWSA
ncbi:DUF4240 domain-containing protein [Micromonospora chokoriensis]|uniref:DUF4240 domain-containing protein n=1 Tax=Micromonospora chokoriensis TaxID=356851 RepID=A0A1C4UWK1_9ACTN|nr:DUF4240 domain-containing protein [Micromonospora chokoriensis]SCE76097.1 Protein of unknown function [Micromonospora chokoriensis]